MANAAAKKAAAARGAATATYFPIVLALNLGYLFLRLVYQWSSSTIYTGVATTSLIGLSCVSYKGILEDHAHPSTKRDSPDALAGGASLDLLGLVTVIQYGTVLISEKLYWALVVIPLWGGWKLYSIFGSKRNGAGLMQNNSGDADDSEDEAATEKAEAKRQKRAERRRQKRA